MKETAAEVKKAVKSAAKKAKKPEQMVILQYYGTDVSVEDLVDRAIAQFSSLNPDTPVKKINLYLKPEDRAAYYVINEVHLGQVNF